MLKEIKYQLKQAQDRMKLQYDMKHRELTFQEGDHVYIKLKPCRQHLVLSHSSHKFSPRFVGPFSVIHKIGSVVYEVQLPAGSKIHNVFHVLVLKQALGRHEVADPLLLTLISETGGTFVEEPS